MPLYEYQCEKCGHVLEIMRGMSEDKPEVLSCDACGGGIARRIFSFASGNKEYSKPIISQSLAINPSQAAEHRQHFPDIELKDNQFPVFENYQQHDRYLEKTGFVKQRALHNKSRNGKIIERVTMGDVRRRLELKQGNTE